MLENKHILITGASRGIGKSIAEVCVALGATVYLGGRDDEALDKLALGLGDNAVAFSYDVTDHEQVKAAFAHIQKYVGKLDGLVNNAGIMLDAPLSMTKLEHLQQQLNVNTIAAFQHSQLASRLMTKQRSGCIVNLCSAVGEHGSAGQSAYATSKAALSGMTKSLAKELAALGIRVNGIAPGFVETDLVSHYTTQKQAEVVEAIALGRVGKAKEVADLVSFMLSDHSAYITGQIIGIDGGMKL